MSPKTSAMDSSLASDPRIFIVSARPRRYTSTAMDLRVIIVFIQATIAAACAAVRRAGDGVGEARMST